MFRFTDPHIHLWQAEKGWWAPPLQPGDPPSILGDVNQIRGKDFLVDDYRRESAQFDIKKVVHVTAAMTPPSWPAETRFVQQLLDESELSGGIIATTDFDRPLAEVDAELAEHAESPSFRGLRHWRGVDFADDHVLDCFALMQSRGLIYDVVANEDSLENAAKAAAQFDAMSFILEHTGSPTRLDADVFAQWRRGMEAFAAQPNTAVKISGLGMISHSWTTDELRPWIEAAIQAFGADRAMFATNFPIDWIYSEFDTVLEAYQEITSGASDAEREALFVTSAEHWYAI